MKGKLEKIFIFIFSIAYSASLDIGIIKYVISLGICWLMFNVILKNNSIIEDKYVFKVAIIFTIPVIYMSIYSLVIFLIKSEYETFNYMLKQVVFILLPISTSYSIVILTKRYKLNLVKIAFISISIYYVIKIASTGMIEGTESFIYGLFFTYFIYKCDYKFSLISFLLLIISSKRIALGASIIIILIHLILKNLNYKKKHIILKFIYFSICMSSLIYVYLIYLNQIDSIFRNLNIIDMGRSNIYSLFDGKYAFKLSFIGNGAAYTDYILKLLNLPFAGNLHSDILKLYIELGMFGYILYIQINYWIYKYIVRVDKEIGTIYMYLFIYTLINYFTDNLLIYIYYWIPFYIIVFYELNSKIKKVS